MDPDGGATVGVVILGIAGLMALFGWLSFARLIPRNRIVGFRTSDTLQSDAAWDAGQRAGAPWMFAAAGISALTAVALVITDPARAAAERVGALGLLVAVVVVAVGAVQSGRAARSAHGADPG